MSGIDLYRPAAGFPHGSRARYVGERCRCDDCRRANREYAAARARARAEGDTGELVDAGPARAHLEALAAQGVGRRAVAAACDVALSVLLDVRRGRKLRVRASTARRILAVDAGAISDGGRVPAGATRTALRELLRAGLTKTEIARRLGSAAKVPSLQLVARHVTAKNALKVQKLLVEVRAELAIEQAIGSVCPDCCDSHAPERRQEWLRSHPDVDPVDAVDARPCWWGGASGYSMLLRDRAALRRRAA